MYKILTWPCKFDVPTVKDLMLIHLDFVTGIFPLIVKFLTSNIELDIFWGKYGDTVYKLTRRAQTGTHNYHRSTNEDNEFEDRSCMR